jgi:hypothetical protein
MRSDKLLGTLVGASFAIAALSYCGGVAPSSADGPDAGKTSCDCPVAPAAVVKSGTRLKARKLTSPDGASQFLGWWDDELKIRCEGNDGRCMPASGSRVGVDAQHFADAACTTPVGVSTGGASVPQYCLDPNGFRLGMPISKVYTRDGSGSCVEAHDGFAEIPGATFYACGGELVAPETFAAMTETRD